MGDSPFLYKCHASTTNIKLPSTSSLGNKTDNIVSLMDA